MKARLIGLTTVLAIAALATTAAAELPFLAVADGIVGFPGGNKRTLTLFDGHASQMGAIDGAANIVVRGNRSFVDMVLANGQGDVLNLMAVVEFDDEFGGQRGEYVITGGEGKLAGASGGGAISFQIRETDPDVLGELRLEGTIDIP